MSRPLNLVITLLVYSRPAYTREVLRGLAACRGLDDLPVIVFTHEPAHQAVLDVLREATFPLEVIIERVEPRHGTPDGVADANLSTATRRSMELGFATGADFVVHLEDDTVPAPDFLEYMQWAAEAYRDDPDILMVGAYERRMQPPASHRHHAVRRIADGCTSWGWGTWRDRWEADLAPGWVDHNWDWNLLPLFRGRCGVLPVLGRIQNIGAGGVHTTPEQNRDQQYTPVWSANVEMGDDPWHEEVE